ncbi:MAG: iron-containing alcohol dehydrogenase [Spirochaetia bacterium]|nr:iron-containing alcohol dehydrogenase [Spirochaetia bacterium]
MLGRKSFDFYSPSKIIFSDSPQKIADEVKKFGNRFLILNLRKENYNPAGLKSLRESINANNSGCIIHDEIIGLPDTEQVDSAAFFAKKSHIDCIIAYGGIETMNAAKAISILVTNSFFAQDLFEQDEQAIQKPIPVITVPIEPCLGEEITSFFSLVDAHQGIRKIFSSDNMYPQICFVDPNLCIHLKADDIARISGALLSTIIECVLRPDNNMLTDILLYRAIDILTKDIEVYYKNPGSEKTLQMMYWLSLMCGMSLMNNPNGLNWAISQVLGIKTKLTFHQALSLMIPFVMEFYLTSSANRLVLMARSMNENTGDVSVAEAAIMAIEAVRKLYKSINLPTNLSEFYITRDHISEVAVDVSKLGFLETSSRRIGAQEISAILLTAL